MAGTPEGGRKAAITNRERYGSDFYTNLGAIKSPTKGFGGNKRRAKLAAKKGGRAIPTEEQRRRISEGLKAVWARRKAEARRKTEGR